MQPRWCRDLIRAATLSLLLSGAGVLKVAGQQRQLSLEVNPIHATLAYGWATGPARTTGVEIGFGFPQIDRTMLPTGESLTDFFHVGGFLRANPSRSVALDARAQLGLAELRGCSGCLPGALTAISGGAFIGGRRAKIGARLTAGVITEYGEPAAFVLNLTPLSLLFTHAW